MGTIHVHAPTPHAPPLQAFLADFSQVPEDQRLYLDALDPIVWRCSRVKVLIGVVWTCVMFGLYEGYFKKQSHPCSAIAWIVWWFFAIIATLCLVIWTLLDLRSKPPARR